MSSQSIRQELVNVHIESFREALDTLLTGCTKNNDIRSDANILKVKEYTEQVLAQYDKVWTEVSSDLTADRSAPDVIKQMNYPISINEEKYAKVKEYERAVLDRETRLADLSTKVNILRSTVPGEIESSSK